MKLICELNEEIEMVTEEVNGSKNLYIKGVYLQAGIKNRNGRIYDPSIMENAVDAYIESHINRRLAYGELNHPNTPALNPERYSHRILELKRVGNDWHGKSLVMNTPMGNIVKGVLESGGAIGVSSRGMGTLKKSATATHVCEDFRLSTAADVVSDPSAPNAFVNGIMEGVDWVWDESNGYQAIRLNEEIKGALDKNRNAFDPAKRLKLFENFCSLVSQVQFKPQN